MAPKKAKKISLNEFLGDNTLGSWADEMDSLPNAPAIRAEGEQGGDRHGRRDDFLSSRPDRQSIPPREDIPLPTQPPFTAFVGNLAFDLTETELGDFFIGSKTKSVKIIKDKEEKPKGFGYVEFEDLDGLRDAISKSGSSFSGRIIRVSVAEPPKERGGFGAPSDDSAKFENPWRRDGPLPDLPSRDASRRRFEGSSSNDRQLSSVSEGAEDWRSSRPPKAIEAKETDFKRKGSGHFTPEAHAGSPDKEEVWTIGSKFKPSVEESGGSRFGSGRTKSEMGPPKDPVAEEQDWRSSARPPKSISRNSISPNNSTPPTPQLARKKLELLPRSGNASASPSPLSSPKMGPTPPISAVRPNPFAGARPVDVSSREKEVAGRLEKEREASHERLVMSRSNSRTGVDRGSVNRPQTPPVAPSIACSAVAKSSTLAPTVRPSLSFANVAAKKESVNKRDEGEQPSDTRVTENLTENLPKISI